MDFDIRGQLIDVIAEKIFPARVVVQDGVIASIEKIEQAPEQYILPGFVDAHIHIESSMLPPTEFARLSSPHGTVATVSDPHEIANVLGMQGVEYMLEDAKNTPFKFFFGAPSCVPATSFETAGAVLGAQEVETLLQKKEILYLSEVMNYPGVIHQDPELMAKIISAKKHRKKIDGHAPGLRGELLKKYVQAGIETDHECFTYEEALEKKNLGLKILIREGSAAKNFEALLPLLLQSFKDCMFCSDDKHPDELIHGHINQLVQRAIQAGLNPLNAIQVASLHPIKHYNLPVGLLQKNDPADFQVIKNFHSMVPAEVYISGKLVAREGKTLLPYVQSKAINHFQVKSKAVEDFQISAQKEKVQVIEAIDGELITKSITTLPKVVDNQVVTDIDRDLLKIGVVCRYKEQKPAMGLIKNFGLKSGAIASTIAHDSHNIIVVGVDDASICQAVNALIQTRGGIVVVENDHVEILPLDVAGLMSTMEGEKVAASYEKLDRLAKSLGCTLKAPFMTLSFMALLVIPSLKISDLGLFDGSTFTTTDLFVAN